MEAGMDATDRIAETYDRLVALGPGGIATRSVAERIVFYVVATRCFIDIDGFASVYEQDLNQGEIAILVEGLNRIGEDELAEEFGRGFELLKRDGFYEHMNWDKVSDSVRAEIEAIGEKVGDRLWALDEKMATLLGDACDVG
jgi:hypothetical protein